MSLGTSLETIISTYAAARSSDRLHWRDELNACCVIITILLWGYFFQWRPHIHHNRFRTILFPQWITSVPRLIIIIQCRNWPNKGFVKKRCPDLVYFLLEISSPLKTHQMSSKRDIWEEFKCLKVRYSFKLFNKWLWRMCNYCKGAFFKVDNYFFHLSI